ncbi:MAG: TonB-dependent receptor [Bacteroidota bacterium]
MKYLFVLAGLWLAGFGMAFCQAPSYLYSGKVWGQTEEKGEQALVQASVRALGTTGGTFSDAQGAFMLRLPTASAQLVISYVGYRTDTLAATAGEPLKVVLQAATLEAVTISRRNKSTRIAGMKTQKVLLIDESELMKAACCNLSESFETSPSVDVSFTDAITGTRQIQMLGLAGPYTQINRENMPGVRGLNAMYGMTFIPGHWVQSIQLGKGTGSVINGYEAIAGQLNIELRKPETAPRVHLNGYANLMGRYEGNANFAHRFDSTGKGWSTALLLHGSGLRQKNDRNQDGFLDRPLFQRLIGLHRWKYIGKKAWRFQAGVKGTYASQQGGQLAFDPDLHQPGEDFWGMTGLNQRLEGFAKLGRIFPHKPWQSFGFQLSGSHHEQATRLGGRRYLAQHQSLYANFLYQSIFHNTNHTYRTGLSVLYDDMEEQLDYRAFARQELVPGAFFEYTYTYLTKFSLLAGLRLDHHNLFGAFLTPRLHVRYAPSEQTTFRLNLGRGQRTANILAENQGMLASARELIIVAQDSTLPYGLQAEVAWNAGASFTQNFELDYREGTFTVDFHRTEFLNQIVVDRDRNPQQLVFYNLEGRSYSNSLHTQLDYELVKFLDVRLAYRWLDVRTTYDGVLRSKPLVAQHRAFVNLAYTTRDDWAFDLTVNRIGSQRLPDTDTNPEAFQLMTASPAFWMLNAQVTKPLGKSWEVYLGGENLLDQRQENPILSAEQPFGVYFDPSMVWGPIFGRNVYLGFRYKVE